jgi:hypothetical protein
LHDDNRVPLRSGEPEPGRETASTGRDLMPAMSILLNGEDAWPELKDLPADNLIHVTDPIQVARLKGGMASGKTSVAIRIDLPDGRVVIAETSLELWNASTAAFRGAEERDAAIARGDN